MPTILVCPDSFKGCLDAGAAARALCRGITAARPSLTVRAMPVADGGEGTLDALCPAGRVTCTVHDPLMRPVTAAFGVLGEGEEAVAVIEMAQAAGLTLCAEEERDPLRASSFGVGEMIAAALDRGCRRLLITVGGSGTNDGGCGMLCALGLRLLDADGAELSPTGGALAQVTAIDLRGLDPRLAACTVTVATDVTNPLCGAQGATAVFGPQKGADSAALGLLETGMRRFAGLVDAAAGRPVSETAGCGAGGGLPLGLLAFTAARICPGIDAVLDLLGFDGALADASLVITGEGRTDGQSACGKAVAGVARRAAARGVPVYVLSGALSCGDGAADALEAVGVRGMMSILSAPCTLREAMEPERAAVNLAGAAGRLVRMLFPADPREAGMRYAAAQLAASDASCVLAPPGRAPRLLYGRGIAPLVHALRGDAAAFSGCAVADRIVGLAAANLFFLGGAHAVWGEVMSEAADRFLTERGIVHGAGTLAPQIINRRGDGVCPMEARAMACTTPEEVWAALDAALEQAAPAALPQNF